MFVKEGPWAQCLWKGARRKLDWAKGEVELPCRPDSLNSTGSSGVRMTHPSCPDRPKRPILYPHLHESLNAGSLWRGVPLGRLLSAAQAVLRGLKTDGCPPPSNWTSPSITGDLGCVSVPEAIVTLHWALVAMKCNKICQVPGTHSDSQSLFGNEDNVYYLGIELGSVG